MNNNSLDQSEIGYILEQWCIDNNIAYKFKSIFGAGYSKPNYLCIYDLIVINFKGVSLLWIIYHNINRIIININTDRGVRQQVHNLADPEFFNILMQYYQDAKSRH